MNASQSSPGLMAGAAVTDITPTRPVFLFGYPHVPRTSTGVHDSLECAALYVAGGGAGALFLAHDLIFVPSEVAAEARGRIAALTGLPQAAIMITATHTHSGPITAEMVSNAADPVVPKPDRAYLAWLCDRIVNTGVRAVHSARPAEIGLATANADGVGTNRHDPCGPADAEVPVLVARHRHTRRPLGCMVVYAMHPTVLHEDSTLISGDFPHFTRRHLQSTVLGSGCPVVYHNGASGDQSPRHVTRGNTFAEARRIGERLGEAIAQAIGGMTFGSDLPVRVERAMIELLPREFPAVDTADGALAAARERFESLKRAGAPAPEVRTAECDVFGAEETAELARGAADGRLRAAIAARTPAEVQLVRIGTWSFVGWPGEYFVDYALAVRARCAHAYVITLANGDLQGYIVTPDAAARGCYEAFNAVFSPVNGQRFVDATLALLARA